MELTESNESPPAGSYEDSSTLPPLVELSVVESDSFSDNNGAVPYASELTEMEPQRLQLPDTSSPLAFASSTPWLARVLLPAVCIATHLMFYYGQTAPMWKLRAFADIDTWANATDFPTRRAFDTVGLPYDNHLTYEEDNDVQTFTYYYAIHHLWQAKNLPGKVLPRLAAVLLIIFSGIWPHLKLVWLQGTWFFGRTSSKRTTTLQWLSTLGKWSLADVLVVCVMVGVLHLDWLVDPGAIKAGIIADLPALLAIVQSQYNSTELCDKLLKITCGTQRRVTKIAKCKACQGLVSEAYARPEWARSTGQTILNGVDTNGGGIANLRVVGMRGIYAFCGAVIVSILLSLIVDLFDHRAKQQVRDEQTQALGQRRLQRVMRQHRAGEESTSEDSSSLEEPLLGNGPSPMEVDFGDDDDQPLPSVPTSLFSWRFIVTTWIATAMVFWAVDCDTMERQVHGAGPMLLHDILGVSWERPYSLRSLMWTTGDAGGWDYLLMATFGLFCVLGPAIRAVLLVVVTLLDRCKLPVAPLTMLINFIGAFCSWEVFAIAIVMVQMLMPSITDTIIQNKACEQVSEDGSCLQVEFNILPVPFTSIVIGGCLLLATSWIAVRRSTDRGASPPTTASRATVTTSLAHVMAANHDYQRDQVIGQRTSETVDDGLQELVFETNQV
jgi:hypothetical protein